MMNKYNIPTIKSTIVDLISTANIYIISVYSYLCLLLLLLALPSEYLSILHAFLTSDFEEK